MTPRQAPVQWPHGVIVGVAVAVVDVASKTFLGEVALDSAGGIRRIAPSAALVNVVEGPAEGSGLGLLLLTVAALLVLLVLLRVRRRVTAIGLGLMLGGLLGKALDRWDDGAAIDILRLSGLPPLNLADLSLTAGLLTLLAGMVSGRQRRTSR